MSDYTLTYQSLPPPIDEAVQAAIIPWDSEIFGFPVAELRLPVSGSVYPAAPIFQETLATWARATGVRLASMTIPAVGGVALAWLQRAGFRFIDCFVTTTLTNLQTVKLPLPPLPLRPATVADLPRLEEMAGRAFGTGRYHADPDFPRNLADRRYRAWVRNAFERPTPGTHIFVADDAEGVPAGFVITVVDSNGIANAHFTCVAPEHQGSVVGYSLAVGQSQLLRDLGVRKTRGRLSVSNLPIFNINIRAGSHVLESEFVLHWHSPTLGDVDQGTP